MASNYDNTAWFYDTLSGLMFGSSLKKSQVALLKYIPQNSTIIIVGGGTGWILDEITKLYPAGLNIIYVEISANMTALSKKRNTGNNRAQFINKAVEQVVLNTPADVIFTPFLFDNFSKDALSRLFAHLNQQLKEGGIWLNTDFQIAGRWWHKLMLKSMYLFFKLFKAVDVNELQNVLPLFEEKGYELLTKQFFYGKFIISTAFRKR